MHQQVFSYHSTDSFSFISHRNGNKLDNRYRNLVVKYSTGSRNVSFHASDNLRTKLNSIAPNLVINNNGLVLKHSITGVIELYSRQVDLLLCQRLKAAQLIVASRNELIGCKAQLIEAVSDIDEAIAFLNQTISTVQPK